MIPGLALDGPRHGPACGRAPRALVVLLHGLGADGGDLIGLAPHWARHLPQAAFVAPDAPFPCDMAPYGRQWFSLQEDSPERMLASIRAAAGMLDAFLDAELTRTGLAEGAVALVGFSQGTMMALHVGPRRAGALAGILGYSGALLAPRALAEEARTRPPVLLVHGDADPVVPAAAMSQAAAGLAAAGIAAETVLRPGLAHAIDPEGLALGAAFLARHLPVTGR
jgi:phospholipase/carboxylesterase